MHACIQYTEFRLLTKVTADQLNSVSIRMEIRLEKLIIKHDYDTKYHIFDHPEK